MKKHHGVDLKLNHCLRYRRIREMKEQGLTQKDIRRLILHVNEQESQAGTPRPNKCDKTEK